MPDDPATAPGESETMGSRSRRRLIVAGAVGAAAAVVGGQQAQAASGGGDQGPLVMGSNAYFKASVPQNVNTPNVSSVATVLAASPNYANFAFAAGAFVFRADATPSGPSVGVNGLEGYGVGPGGCGVVAGGPQNGFGLIASGGVVAVSASCNSVSGDAVRANATAGSGIDAYSDSGWGGTFRGGRAAIHLEPRSAAGPPTTNEHSKGELAVDSEGNLYLCKADGTPGTWVKLNEQPSPPTPPAFTPLSSPERFVDTRTGLGGVQGPVPGGTTSTFQMTGRNGAADNPALQIPAGATAVVGNLTVIGSAGAPIGSYVTLWPSGPRPTTSSINFGPGAVVANAVTVGLAPGDGGQKVLSAFAQQTCDYIIDIAAYFA